MSIFGGMCEHCGRGYHDIRPVENCPHCGAKTPFGEEKRIVRFGLGAFLVGWLIIVLIRVAMALEPPTDHASTLALFMSILKVAGWMMIPTGCVLIFFSTPLAAFFKKAKTRRKP
jgi:hypothetical protein